MIKLTISSFLASWHHFRLISSMYVLDMIVISAFFNVSRLATKRVDEVDFDLTVIFDLAMFFGTLKQN